MPHYQSIRSEAVQSGHSSSLRTRKFFHSIDFYQLLVSRSPGASCTQAVPTIEGYAEVKLRYPRKTEITRKYLATRISEYLTVVTCALHIRFLMLSKPRRGTRRFVLSAILPKSEERSPAQPKSEKWKLRRRKINSRRSARNGVV